jgi:hypothetical protein
MNGRLKHLVALVAWIGTISCATIGYSDEPPAATNAQLPTAAEIAAWTKNLDDARYLVREEATQQLLATGEAALDPLLVVANGDQLEPADRAIWILRRLGRSRDNGLALAALDRLVQLNDRPGIVSKAVADLRDRSIAACEERLAPLGAEMASQLQATETGLIPMLVVRFGEKWRGSGDDLRQIAELKELRHFRLEGPPVTDEVVKMFAAKEKLAYLQLFDTKVTPAAVDAVKDKHPDAIVYVRNKAMLGVAAESHQDGVRVVAVVQGTGAATAGIVVHDIIATIDGHPLPDFDRLTARIAQHHPGDKIEVEIIRNSERMKFTPVLGARPEGE